MKILLKHILIINKKHLLNIYCLCDTNTLEAYYDILDLMGLL